MTGRFSRNGALNPWRDSTYRNKMVAIHTERCKDPGVRRQLALNASKNRWSSNTRKRMKAWWKKHREEWARRQRHLYAIGVRKLVAKGKSTETVKGGKILCHGGDDPENNLEQLFACMLDASPIVRHFEKDYHRVSYSWKGIRRTYFPDFWVVFKDGRKVVFELNTVVSKRNHEKFRWARLSFGTRGIIFVVVRTRELKDDEGCIDIMQRYFV